MNIKLKNIVIYESRYGSTEKYAKWIGEELKCKVSKIDDIKIDDLLNYDNIVFGGWLHAGKLKGFRKIEKSYQKLKDKNLIVFMVGLCIMDDKTYEELMKNNFSNINNIKPFYLRGAFNFEKLSKIDKFMMSGLRKFLESRKEEEKDENVRGMIDAYDNPVDFTNKDNIKPIIDIIKSMDTI